MNAPVRLMSTLYRLQQRCEHGGVRVLQVVEFACRSHVQPPVVNASVQADAAAVLLHTRTRREM